MSTDYRVIAKFDVNILLVEAREYSDGEYRIYWTDGPRAEELPADDRAHAVDEVEQAAADHATIYGEPTEVIYPSA